MNMISQLLWTQHLWCCKLFVEIKVTPPACASIATSKQKLSLYKYKANPCMKTEALCDSGVTYQVCTKDV